MTVQPQINGATIDSGAIETAMARLDVGPEIKVVVFDVDGTLVDGEVGAGPVTIRPQMREAVLWTGERGLLASLCSRNQADRVQEVLDREGLGEEFAHPQIHPDWSTPKSAWLHQISAEMNLSTAQILYVDNDPFERAQVRAALPDLLVVDVPELWPVLRGPRGPHGEPTPESRARRRLYRDRAALQQVETAYVAAGMGLDTFLELTTPTLTVHRAVPEDFARAWELTRRVNQLRTSANTYDVDQLTELAESPGHRVLVATMSERIEGRTVEHGRIALAVLDAGERTWHLRLLLASCRVLTRSAGMLLLTHIMTRARDAGASGLLADLVQLPEGRNAAMYDQVMYLAFRSRHFRVINRDESPEGDRVLLQSDLTRIPAVPGWATITVLS